MRSAKLGKPSLRGPDQVADERDRVLEDALERGAGLLDVAHEAGLDDVEDDLEQVPDRAPGPS